MTALHHLPDDTVVYISEIGECTLGDVRTGSEGIATEDDATVRMWCLIMLYNPKASPWRSGRIRVGSKEYPLSVCMSDRFLPLSTSSGTFADADISAPLSPSSASPSPTNDSP